jgi:PBP1b-binding outer membrane lipoprotein LpoB
MKLHIASAAVVGLLAMFAAGCASTTPAPKAEAPAPAAPAKPTLTDEAKQALAQAEADAAAAKKAFALWIPAETALTDAQAAAKEGDSAAVIKQAKKVSDLTKLGMAQTKYASTELQ